MVIESGKSQFKCWPYQQLDEVEHWTLVSSPEKWVAYQSINLDYYLDYLSIKD